MWHIRAGQRIRKLEVVIQRGPGVCRQQRSAQARLCEPGLGKAHLDELA